MLSDNREYLLIEYAFKLTYYSNTSTNSATFRNDVNNFVEDNVSFRVQRYSRN
jgi:hypothetical protein